MTNDVVESAATRTSTGIVELDDLLHGGLRKGTVTVVAGHAGAGHSHLALQIARISAGAGWGANVFALGTSVEDVWRRTLSGHLAIKETAIPDTETEQIATTVSKELGGRFRVSAVSERHVHDVLFTLSIAECTDLVVIDPLNLVGVVADDLVFPPSPELDSRETADFLRHLKVFALDHRKAVVVVVDLPTMSASAGRNSSEGLVVHLAAVGPAAQIADTVFMVYRSDLWDGFDPRAGEVDIVVAKGGGPRLRTITVAEQLQRNRLVGLGPVATP